MVDFRRPALMAIINATDNSFFANSRCALPGAVAAAVKRAVARGADIIDVGACSTRPGSVPVSVQVEIERIVAALEEALPEAAGLPVSVDTFRPEVAAAALELGAQIINDISGGSDAMLELMAGVDTPYIYTCAREMAPDSEPCLEVARQMAEGIERLQAAGVDQVILDPGFGFGKTVEQNGRLLRDLRSVSSLFEDYPLLVGISRKSMLYKPLGLNPEDVLPATCAANVLALQGGAKIIRVHDVAPARQIIDWLFP